VLEEAAEECERMQEHAFEELSDSESMTYGRLVPASSLVVFLSGGYRVALSTVIRLHD